MESRSRKWCAGCKGRAEVIAPLCELYFVLEGLWYLVCYSHSGEISVKRGGVIWYLDDCMGYTLYAMNMICFIRILTFINHLFTVRFNVY
jgi:hypothetical protein